jgi:hypothetical protein
MRLLLLLLAAWPGAGRRHEVFVDRRPHLSAHRDLPLGSRQRPFRTVGAAVAAIRSLPKQCGTSGSLAVRVTIAGGLYGGPDNSLELDALDSGCAETPVIFRADPGDPVPVTLHGGAALSPASFRRAGTIRGRTVYSVDLRSLGLAELARSSSNFQTGWSCANGERTELFFAGVPMHLARHPNISPDGVWQWMRQGATVNSSSFEPGTNDASSGEPVHVDLQWAGERSMWAHGFWSWDWADEFVAVSSVGGSDANATTIQLRAAPKYGLKRGSRYMLLNGLSLLDAPNEYVIVENGTLFLIPPDGHDPTVAPSGGAGAAAAGAFLSQRQHAHTLNGTSHLMLQGLRFEYAMGSALLAANVTDVRIENCTLANSGTHGVNLTGVNSSVERSEVLNVGCDGVWMRGGDAVSLTAGRLNVSANSIHDYARVSRTVRPGISWSGCGNVVAGNEIYRAPHSGIMIAPPSDGVGVNTLFADNHLHDLCQGTADAGGFYAGDSWANRGNVVRGNRFERLFPTEKMAQVRNKTLPLVCIRCVCH